MEGKRTSGPAKAGQNPQSLSVSPLGDEQSITDNLILIYTRGSQKVLSLTYLNKG